MALNVRTLDIDGHEEIADSRTVRARRREKEEEEEVDDDDEEGEEEEEEEVYQW